MARPRASLDRAGRPQHDPKPLFEGARGLHWMLERIPAAKVPGEYFSLDVAELTPLQRALEHDPEPLAVVSCPCGHSHAVALLEAPAKCAVEDCDCDRYFVFDGKDVWVFNSPSPREPPPTG